MSVVLRLSLNCSRNCRSIGGDDAVSNVFLSVAKFPERWKPFDWSDVWKVNHVYILFCNLFPCVKKQKVEVWFLLRLLFFFFNCYLSLLNYLLKKYLITISTTLLTLSIVSSDCAWTHVSVFNIIMYIVQISPLCTFSLAMTVLLRRICRCISILLLIWTNRICRYIRPIGQ